MITCALLAPAVAQTGKPAPAKTPAKAPAPSGLKSFSQVIPGSAARLDMVAVAGGTVTLPPAGGKGAPRKVALKPFWIGRTETPWEAFDPFIASGPPTPAYDRTVITPDAIARPSTTYIPPDMGWGHHGYPVICESELTAEMYCRWLSKATGRKYRLPTEAEWQWACQAGAAAPAKLTPADVQKRAWTKEISNGQSHPVAKKLPNAWGLYDMLGNAGEWVLDVDAKTLAKPMLCGGTFQDPAAKLSPTARAVQTPEWQATDPQFPKSRWWLADAPFAGFRVVCVP